MYVQSGQSIFAVYNTKKIWAVLNVFPQDVSLIHTGDSVSIIPETDPSNIIHAKVNYIEPVVGQNASAIKIRVYLENTSKPLEIGTLVNAQIIPKTVEGFWLPRKSVINLGRDQIVFIKSGDHFLTRNIQTGILTDSLVQIISGLKGDEQIAENAQFLVDSESFIKSDHENK
jgi:Cu(I)/Ag(I) efflux system membrane fusion protein